MESMDNLEKDNLVMDNLEMDNLDMDLDLDLESNRITFNHIPTINAKKKKEILLKEYEQIDIKSMKTYLCLGAVIGSFITFIINGLYYNVF